MSVSIGHFEEFFGALYKDRRGEPIQPFPWQIRLARQVHDGGWPDCIDLPTASGKTACIDIAVFVLACQSRLQAEQRTVGRRIFFTVNRRVIVDEAFNRAMCLAQKLLDAKEGILKDVADALRSINDSSDDRHAPPLDVAQLRGGTYRDGAWARSLTQPMVVCTTADQLGSRLLFRGYGVSDSMKPLHAALCSCDSLVLLDEAHVTAAFCQTMELIARYQCEQTVARMRFVQMTATPTGGVKHRFTLDEADLRNDVLRDRQTASKPATLLKLERKKPIVDEIVRFAKEAAETPRAIGIIVNRVQTARAIHEKLRTAFPQDVHLVIGRMRPIDRDELQERLRDLVGPGRPNVLPRPVFVVATQCLEVGADYDFDALITECASIDALRQRFGRLNRKGRKRPDGTPIDVVAAILKDDAGMKDEDPIYGDALRHTWEWLWSMKKDDHTVDFGIAAFQSLWSQAEEQRETYLVDGCPKPLLAPASNAAVLLPAHLDALCQTSPQPVPSPDVNYFIHGPRRDMAEVNVCWRADLGGNSEGWAQIVSMLPPTSPECMTVPLHVVAQWMRQERPLADADVPVSREEDRRDRVNSSSLERPVLIWRGKDDSQPVTDPRELRPGDTVVIPSGELYRDSLLLGHVPRPEELDVAEIAVERARRQRVIRVHPDVNPHLDPELLAYAKSEEAQLTKSRIRDLLGPLANGFRSGPEEVDYPSPDGSPRPGIVLRFNTLLPKANPLAPSSLDDDEDASVDSTRPVSLDDHLADVGRLIRSALDRLAPAHKPTISAAGDLHDLGKADLRFNAMLAGITPYEAIERKLLAKSGQRGLSQCERTAQVKRAMLPPRFRHEMLSVQMIEHFFAQFVSDPSVDRDLLLHLVAAHHGYGRPFAPVVPDEGSGEVLSIEINGVSVTPEQRNEWIPAHRLDSGVAERFWDLTRKHGWWGLAYMEAILRLADQQASAMEQEGEMK